MYNSFLAFWDFGVNWDMILRDDSSIIQYKQFLYLVSDEFTNALRRNVQGNMSTIFVLVSNVNFKENECQKSGVLAGSIMRKIFSFSFAD